VSDLVGYVGHGVHDRRRDVLDRVGDGSGDVLDRMDHALGDVTDRLADVAEVKPRRRRVACDDGLADRHLVLIEDAPTARADGHLVLVKCAPATGHHPVARGMLARLVLVLGVRDRRRGVWMKLEHCVNFAEGRHDLDDGVEAAPLRPNEREPSRRDALVVVRGEVRIVAVGRIEWVVVARVRRRRQERTRAERRRRERNGRRWRERSGQHRCRQGRRRRLRRHHRWQTRDVPAHRGVNHACIAHAAIAPPCHSLSAGAFTPS
jgi:hypothetical protein